MAAGADALLLDDGFQNPGLAKDLSLVVVDAGFGFGNGRVMPAGPLREPVAAGLARADLVLAIGPEPARARLRCRLAGARRAPPARGRARAARRPAWTGVACARSPSPASAARRSSSRPSAASGSSLSPPARFDDHAPYDPRLLARLAAEARAARAQLVTTEKDAVRLPAAFRSQVLVLPVRLVIADWGPIDARLSLLGL